ncbi:MAG TPA: hypothetical protein DEP66_04290 [Acidimicrobiaceae bacterium]|nr:hypothetical protein [Acidimicrobiaceae bacterium]HCB37422.1 hypothetical protein [Acidimicrobiaceae bacterium]
MPARPRRVNLRRAGVTRIRRTWDASPEEVDALLAPRDDIVAERVAPPDEARTGAELAGAELAGEFALAAGPFDDYRRTVRVAEAAPSGTRRRRVVEQIDYRLAVPWFGPVVNVLVRRALRRPPLRRPADGTQPAWAPPQRLDPRAATMFAAVAVVVMLAGFLSNAPSELHTYAADEFGSGHLSQGLLGAVVRVGSLFAIGAAVLADRHGRRRVLALAMATGIAASLAAALVPNLATLTAALTVARTATSALGAVAVVIALEEMPDGCRAWSLSVLALAGALGAGVVVWLQPLADVAPWAWRLIFVVPLAAAPLVPGVMRRLPETRRYRRRARGVPLRSQWPRIALLGGVFFALGLFLGPLDWFRNEFLRDEHGFSAAQVTVFLLTTATPGGIGLWVAGRLSETRGRRPVAVAAATVGLGAAVLMFSVSGPALWGLALAAAVVSSGLLPALGVYRVELFPTAVRTAAGTIAGAMGVAGGSAGVLLAGWLRSSWGSFGPVMAVLWAGPLVAAVVVALWFREGGGRRLEQLNPVDADGTGTAGGGADGTGAASGSPT